MPGDIKVARLGDLCWSAGKYARVPRILMNLVRRAVLFMFAVDARRACYFARAHFSTVIHFPHFFLNNFRIFTLSTLEIHCVIIMILVHNSIQIIVR